VLALHPLQFARHTSNIADTPETPRVGTAFDAGASNADGTAVEVIADLAHDVHLIHIGVGGVSLNANDVPCLLDLLIDPAGGTTWGSFIDDLVCGHTPLITSGIVNLTAWYAFPVFIKAGASLAVQARCAHSADITTGRVVVQCWGDPNRPEMWWCGSKVTSLGINAASSTGTSHTPGDAGVYSSWASVGGTSSPRFGSLQFGVNHSDAGSLAVSYNWQVGYDSVKLPGSPTFFVSSANTEQCFRTWGASPIMCDIPAGKQLQVRGTCSNTAEAWDVALYGTS
jgi:hypothetical protein